MLVQAIVLRSRAQKDYDRVITCYTRELGKIEILVRSAQKLNSKLAPLTSGLYAILVLKIEPGKNYYHLLGGEVKKYFKNILSNYRETWQVGRLLKGIDDIIKLEKPHRQIFELLVKFLEKMNVKTLRDKDILIYAFLIKFLSLLGYQPEIKKCVFCHRSPKAGEKIYFDLAHGGTVCADCVTKKHYSSILINEGALEIMRQLLYRCFDQLERYPSTSLGTSKPDFRRAKVIINRFFKWHLG
jgi:DNA repair protein RecO (recombination protein O)